MQGEGERSLLAGGSTVGKDAGAKWARRAWETAGPLANHRLIRLYNQHLLGAAAMPGPVFFREGQPSHLDERMGTASPFFQNGDLLGQKLVRIWSCEVKIGSAKICCN